MLMDDNFVNPSKAFSQMTRQSLDEYFESSQALGCT